MLTIVLTEIEEKINHLSRQEKLWLIERLARHLQEDADASIQTASNDFARQLSDMANDPQIRAELDKIEQECARLFCGKRLASRNRFPLLSNSFH